MDLLSQDTEFMSHNRYDDIIIDKDFDFYELFLNYN